MTYQFEGAECCNVDAEEIPEGDYTATVCSDCGIELWIN